MIKLCNNCGYIRKPTDKCSDDECPRCGAYYSKIQNKTTKVDTNPSNKNPEESILPGSGEETKSSVNTDQTTEEINFSYYQSYVNEMKDWCYSRNFYFRVPVLVFYFYVIFKQITNHYDGTIFNGINMGIHEGGHPLFSYFGRWLHVAGGTILQWFVPLACTLSLLKQKDYFGISFGMVWFASSMIQTSVYMADARALELPLVTTGGSTGPVAREDIHDWHILFNSVGLIEWDTTIALLVYLAGLAILLMSTGFGCLLTWWMYKGFLNDKNK